MRICYFEKFTIPIIIVILVRAILWYYTPEMRGSYLIKYVLPALVPDLSYNDLEIKEGGAASNTFLSMFNESFEGDVEETRRQLLEYCKLDTFAMVKILEKLLKV